MRRIPAHLLALSLPLLVLAACGDKDEGSDSGSAGGEEGTDDASDGEDDGSDGGSVDCGSNAPTISDITATNNGLVDTDGGEAPSVLLAITANDVDGDLHQIVADVYMDQELDGEVATDSSTFDPSAATLDEPPCEVTDAVLNLALAFPEGSTATLDAPAEFGVYLSDASGNISNFFVVEACLPKADGTDGDCSGGDDGGSDEGGGDGAGG
jgi:hypothetical protein